MLGFGFNKDKVRANADKFVQQGKLQNAIAEYDKILKTDPKDLTILNTVGDLYSRLGQTDQAIHCFKKVGDTYAADGFVPKAIAMYKKLTKLSPTSYDCVQKLGELYTQQGLYNDARAQFLLAAEGLMRGGQSEEAANILKRLLEVDPDNAGVQTKLADIYLKQGKRDAAKGILLSAAESMFSRNAMDAAAEILHRLLTIDKENSRARMMLGQIQIEKGDAAGAIKSLETLPDLDSRPEALKAIMRAYVATGQFTEAEPVARKLYGVHHDISGIALVTEKVVVVDPVKGLKFYEEFGDTLIAASPTSVVASLRGLVSKVQDNVTSLEILLKLFQRAGDTSQNSEIYEMIAHALVQSGAEPELRRAAQLYKQLAVLEPENPLHAQNYRQILTKLGEDPTMIESPISDSEVPFAMEGNTDANWNPAPPTVGNESGSHNFSSLTTAELMEREADQAEDAGAEFSRATQHKTPAGEPAVTNFEIPEEVPHFEVAPAEAPSVVTDFTIPDEPSFAVSGTGKEEVHDLSDEWEKHVTEPDVALVDPTHGSASGLLDSSGEANFRASVQPIPDLVEEIKFYISQKMWHEATSGIEKLIEIAPTNDQIPLLHEQLAAGQAPPAPIEAPSHTAAAEPAEVIEVAPTPAAVPHSTHEVATVAAQSNDVLGSLVNDLESALGDDFAIGGVAAAPHIPAPAPAAATMSAAAYATPTPAPTAAPAPIAAAPSPVATSPAPAAEASKDASLLDDLFDEFKQEMGETSDHSVEDPDTHYNLGVAFKEMGLLDEAIGELQKVCQAIDHGLPFPQTMQAYTWLAHCFVEKGVPEASFMWFDRALSVAKDNDTRAAILYELGSAYEMASQREKAREAFTNVMSINIDFRDVGERIKALKS
jgi:tetratricopeptide (TPR) repeat protein